MFHRNRRTRISRRFALESVPEIVGLPLGRELGEGVVMSLMSLMSLFTIFVNDHFRRVYRFRLDFDLFSQEKHRQKAVPHSGLMRVFRIERLSISAPYTVY